MTVLKIRNAVSAVGMALCLSACLGGGGGGTRLVSTPPPPPAPVVPPPPLPPPPSGTLAALVAPAQTPAPESPTAIEGGASFRNPAVDTVFPLMLTAVTGDGGGDAATTGQGGTLTYGPDGLRLTLNNPAAGVVDAPMNPPLLPPNARPVVQIAGASDLDYTRYGYWTRPGPNAYYDLGAGAWLAGYATPASDIPTAGTAAYAGDVLGLYLLGGAPSICSGCGDSQQVVGQATMSVDFGGRTLSGAMTNLRFTDMDFDMIPLNDLGFNATLDSVRNLFTGTMRVTSSPADATYARYAFSPTATGSISGRFFGPGAREAGAVWTLSDGTNRMIGSMGLKRAGQ